MLTPEEQKAAREKFSAGDFCMECGGLHGFRACPRISSYIIKYKPENPEVVLERHVTFWPPGSWENNVLFDTEVYEDTEEEAADGLDLW